MQSSSSRNKAVQLSKNISVMMTNSKVNSYSRYIQINKCSLYGHVYVSQEYPLTRVTSKLSLYVCMQVGGDIYPGKTLSTESSHAMYRLLIYGNHETVYLKNLLGPLLLSVLHAPSAWSSSSSNPESGLVDGESQVPRPAESEPTFQQDPV